MALSYHKANNVRKGCAAVDLHHQHNEHAQVKPRIIGQNAKVRD